MLKVLIADEDVMLTKQSSNFLLQNNLSIETSSTGISTVTKYFETKPNVLILDSNFSDLKSSQIVDIISESTEEIKKQNIILTFHQNKDKAKFNNTSKIYSFILKPYTNEQLLYSINNASSHITKNKSFMVEESFIYNIFLNLGIPLGNEGNFYLVEILKYYCQNPNSQKKLKQLYYEIGTKYNLTPEAVRSSIRTSLKHIDIKTNSSHISNVYLDLFEKNREISPRYFIDKILPYIYKKLK